MRGYFRWLVIFCTVLPLAAKASLYKFEYTGYVSYLTGDGLGYHLNDSVSGELTFDLTNSNGDIMPESFINSYHFNGSQDFVQGYQPENLGQNIDSVLVYDGVDGNHSLPRLDAGIDIVDANYVDYGASGSRTYGMEANVVFEDFDWLTNGKINTFSFDGADLLASTNSYGVYYDSRYLVDADGKKSWPSDFAWFKLDSAKLSIVDVPEPSALFLLISGGLILFLRRRFAK